MIIKKNILPDHIQRLYYKHYQATTIATPLIGFNARFTGHLNPLLFEVAYINVIRKQEILFAKFQLTNDGLSAIDSTERAYSFSSIDWSRQTLETLQRGILNEDSMDLNPEKGQNISGRLYKMSNSEHIFSVAASHLVADAQSMEILLKDFLVELNFQSQVENQSEESLTFLPPGPLNKQPSYEVTKNIYLLNIQKLKTLSRQEDLSLFSILMAGLTTVPVLKTDTIGVLFSNRTPENKSEVGCFVQAVPVYLNERQSVLEMAKSVRQQVAQIHSSLQKKDVLPAPPEFKVMFSMVKNPDIELHGPDGVKVEYLRRLHSKPECALHIYAYQYQEKLEIVFNYDSDCWDQNNLESMLNRYVENLITISEQKNWQSGPYNNMESRMPEVLFDHVGVAVWEMDIGLMQLQAFGEQGVVKKRVKDNSMNVELASFDTGIFRHIELVTPLNPKAPCVGFLERLGEGPYHCCWQTTSLEVILETLNQWAISYTVIERYGQSALFPETPILFLFVKGVGLVEFIEKKQPSAQPTEPLYIEIISTDLDNASKFFHMLGLKPDHPAKATWQDPKGLFIQTQTKGEAAESFVYRMASKRKATGKITEDSPPSLSHTWKQRICI